jgi:hypothetical protein
MMGNSGSRCKFVLTVMLLLSELTLYYFDLFHSLQCRGSESSKLAEGAGVGKWARGVVSKSQVKSSAPPSARASGKYSLIFVHITNKFSVIAHNYAEGFEDDDPPEDHDDSIPTSWGGLVSEFMLANGNYLNKGRALCIFLRPPMN